MNPISDSLSAVSCYEMEILSCKSGRFVLSLAMTVVIEPICIFTSYIAGREELLL
jgi:hypothetical protein